MQLLQHQKMLQDQQSQLNVANNNSVAAPAISGSGNSGQQLQKVEDNNRLLAQNEQLQSQIEQLQAMQVRVQEHQAAVSRTLNSPVQQLRQLQQQLRQSNSPEVVESIQVKYVAAK